MRYAKLLTVYNMVHNYPQFWGQCIRPFISFRKAVCSVNDKVINSYNYEKYKVRQLRLKPVNVEKKFKRRKWDKMRSGHNSLHLINWKKESLDILI